MYLRCKNNLFSNTSQVIAIKKKTYFCKKLEVRRQKLE